MKERFTRKQMENAIMLSADLYNRIYNNTSIGGDAQTVAGIFIDEACKMEEWLTEKYGKDDDSYLDRLEEYERMMIADYDLRLPEVTEPKEMEFFSIESDGKGGKQIHILGFTYASDNNTEDYWRVTEGTFIIIPLQEFIDNLKQNEDYVSDLWCDAKQYEGDHTDEQVVDIINHYFNGETANDVLHYSEITIDTPCGDYMFETK